MRGEIKSKLRDVLRDVSNISLTFGKLRSKITQRKWSGRRDSNPQHPTWESEFSILYFQYLQNRSEKMYVHALHTVHALPDLRVAGGRLGDGVSDTTV